MRLYQYILYIGIVCLFSLNSCSSDEEKKESDKEEEFSLTKKKEKSQNIFYTLTSPIELMSLINQMGLYYNSDLPNNPENISTYTTTSNQAVNLGVYVADLTYASLFNQIQVTLNYFNASKELADGLGITNAYEVSTLTRIQENINNRDSLLHIISSCLTETDAYLKDNYRVGISLLVLAGGWLEGVYIGVESLDFEYVNSDLTNLIGEQKIPLDNLLKLLAFYEEDSSVDLSGVKKDFTELRSVFDNVKITVFENPSENDTVLHKTTLKYQSTVEVTLEELKLIKNKVSELRNKYTNNTAI